MVSLWSAAARSSASSKDSGMDNKSVSSLLHRLRERRIRATCHPAPPQNPPCLHLLRHSLQTLLVLTRLKQRWTVLPTLQAREQRQIVPRSSPLSPRSKPSLLQTQKTLR